MLSTAMVDGFFYWTGVSVVGFAILAVILLGLLRLYGWLIHDRFNLIFFTKGQRRLSLASWYPSCMVEDTEWDADDHVINERPFYLSYRIGPRRLFLMAGLLGNRRENILKGKHP